MIEVGWATSSANRSQLTHYPETSGLDGMLWWETGSEKGPEGSVACGLGSSGSEPHELSTVHTGEVRG
jgi:hypothetical protein